jgi:hypothetical protein
MHFPEEVVEKASPRGAHVAGRVVIVDGEDSVGGEEGGVLAAMIINRVLDHQGQKFLMIDNQFFWMKIRTRQYIEEEDALIPSFTGALSNATEKLNWWKGLGNIFNAPLTSM